MCDQHLSRRDFIKLSALTVGGVLIAGCRREDIVRVTATPVPAASAQPAATPTRLPAVTPTTAPTLPPGSAADTILFNGNIITIDRADTLTQAVAIKDGLILRTGRNDAIRALAGANTKTIDLRGKTVTPGLIDSHNHLQVWGTLLKNYVPLIPPEVRTLNDLLKRLKDVVAKTKAGEWIQGYYWDLDPLPNRSHLDPIAPNNPLYLMQQGGHYASVNSAALKIANITAQTKNPEGGIIERDKQGNPTGVLYNHRAMDLVRAHVPPLTSKMIQENIRFGEKKMAEAGVTTFHDCNTGFLTVQSYLEAARAKAMMLRAQIFYTLERPADIDRALKEIEHYADDYMRFAGYKFLIDGQFPTWYTHEPHPGVSWNMPTRDPKQFKETVKSLHDTGLQVTVHCGGDAAVDLALEAYEAAMKANPRPNPRHRLEHATLMTKDAVKRAADMGIVISCQPQFLRLSAKLVDYIGKERASRAIVTRDWLNAGITLALGSDIPSTPWYSPQITLANSVLRLDAGNKPLNPEQAMTIQEALRAHTMGSAYAAFEDKVKGSLEPGKMADLAVWDANIYSIKPTEILQTNIEMTMIGGKIVYQKT